MLNSKIFKTDQTTDDNGVIHTKITTSLKARTIAQNELNASIAQNISTLEADKIALTNLEQKVASGIAYEEAYAQTMSKASITAKEYAVQTQGLAGSTETFIAKQQAAINTQQAMLAQMQSNTVATKAATIATRAFSTALNMIAFALIAKGIQLAADAIDHYVNRAKYAAEAMEEAQQKIDDAQKSLKDLSTTLEENKERFLELSKGVDRFSHNISLSEEDYSEYLSISQKLAELSPSLVSGYDEQGNALLDIGNSAEETTEKLNGMLETQQAIAQQTLIDNMDEVADGIYYEVEKAKDNIGALQNQLNNLTNTNVEIDIKKIADENFGKIEYVDNGSIDDKYYKAMENALTSAGIKFEKEGFGSSKFLQIREASVEQLELAQKFYDAALEQEKAYYSASKTGLQKDIQEQEKIISNAYSKMSANLQAWVKDNYNYQYLSDSMQGTIDAIIPQIDWASMGDDAPKTPFEYQDYIVKNFIDPLMKIPEEHKEEINSMFQKLLEFEDGDIDIVPFAQYLQNELEKLNIEIKITPLISGEQTTYNNLQKSMSDFAQKASKATNGEITSQTGRYSNYKEIYNKINDFAQKYEIDTIEEVKAFDEALTKANGDIEKAFEYYLNEEIETLSSTEILSEVEKLSAGLDQLDKIYADVYDKEYFDWSSILNNEDFTKEFGNMTNVTDDYKDAYDNFIKTVSSSSDDLDACQSAFDDLATAYIYNSGVLNKVTEETKNATIAFLEQKGVVNAEEIVIASLTAQKEAEALKEQALAITKDEVTAKTKKEIDALLEEANASEVTKNCLFQLITNEQVFNNTKLDVNGKIKSLEALAKAYSGTAAAAAMSARLTYMKEQAEKSHIGFNPTAADIKDLQDEIYDAVYKPIEVDYGGGSATKAAKDKSSKDSSSKPSTETYDWIEVKIKRLETAIDELDQKATDTYSSLAERTKAYGDEITKVTEEIGLQSQAYNAYMAKANSYGLSADWVAKIQNGSLNIDEVANDTLKEQISNYQTWYEKAQDCLNTVDDLQRKLKDIKIAQIQIKIDDSQATVTKLEQYADKIENRIDNEYKKTSSKDYDRLNTNIKSRISEIEKQNKLLKEQQTIAGKGTEEWDALEEQIRDNQNEIDEFNKKITENKIAKIQLKIEFKGIAFDKLENLLDKLKWTTSLKNVFGFMASKENYTSQNNNIIKQIKNLNEQNKILAQQQKEAKKGSKAWNDYQSQIDDNTDSMRNLTQSMAENAVAKASLADEYAQKKIEKYNSNDELYKAKADNATWFGTKNYYTGRQMANVDNRLSAYNQATKTNLSGLNSATNTINKVKSTKTNKSLLAQVKKYTSAKKEIPASLILKASQLNDNGNLANKLYEYNAYLAAYHTSKDTADLYAAQAKQEKTELLKQQMDNISTYYQNRADRYSQRQTEIENKIAKAEALGFTESATYYKNQANVENGKITTLKAEQVKLEQQLADGLANGKIREGSDSWYELVQQIDDCKNSIDEAANSVIEFNNKVREIEWNRFDNLQDKIALVREELSWMVDELSRDDLTSDETGGITDNGRAVAYLRAVQYETLLKQAEEYRKELSAIEKEISNNPSDINLIERKEELYEAYRDCITGAGDEKEAIIDLYTNGYEALSNKLKELVAEYEELLDAEKNAYDYQQNISDKTKEIATLRKQMLAYSGDISEETRTSVQKINVSLQEAEKSLQEAQYDKFISDSKEMLSDLQEDFDENIQTIIDNLDKNFASLMTIISESATSSANTIATKLESLGYNPTEGVDVVINPTEDNKNGDKSVGGLADTIIEQVKGNENYINKTADNKANKDIAPLSSNSTENTVKSDAAKLKAEADKRKAEEEAKKQAELMKKVEEQTKSIAEKQKIIDNLSKQSQQLQTQYTKAEKDYQIASENVTSLKAKRDKYKKGTDKYNQYNEKVNTAIVNRNKLKAQRDDAKTEYEQLAQELSKLQASLEEDNKVLYRLNSLKSFAKGSNNVKDELAWTQEEGGEIIRTADGAVLTPIGNGGMVFTNEMSQKLWELAKNPAMFMNGFRSAELNLPDVQSTYQSGDVNITFGDIELPNVTDSQDFANSVESVVRNAMCKNGKTLNCVTEAVSAKQLGKGVGHARLYHT